VNGAGSTSKYIPSPGVRSRLPEIGFSSLKAAAGRQRVCGSPEIASAREEPPKPRDDLGRRLLASRRGSLGGDQTFAE
jgi:hypothetical protein